MRPMANALLLLVLTGAALAQEAGVEPVVTVPEGDYQIVRLDLSEGLRGRPQALLLGLRDGRLANFWFVMPDGGDSRLNLRQSNVELKGTTLAGTVEIRTAPGRGRPMVGARLTLALEVSGRKVAGTFEVSSDDPAVLKPVRGMVTGTLLTKPPAGDALPPDAIWPSFWGPGYAMTAAKQPPMIDDLAQARPVWRSEVYVPTAYGNTPDNRYFTRALISGNGGGGSSPVVADGTVYIYFYVPSPGAAVNKENPYWQRTFVDDAAFTKGMEALNATPEEAARVQAHFRESADDHVVAIDAATGATRWTLVLPRRSPNLQTHKHRGISGVPLVAGKTLFVPNLASRLYAIDVANGNLKWESPPFDPSSPVGQAGKGPHNPSPLLLGGTLIWPRGGKAYGLDPDTGKERWVTPGGYMMPWVGSGKERVLFFTGTRGAGALSCVDPTSGKELWRQETDLAAFAPLSAAVGEGILVASPAPVKTGDASTCTYSGWRLSDEGMRKIWQDEPIRPDENLPVTISGGKVYFIGRELVRVLDLATGRKTGERADFSDVAPPHSNPWLGLFGNRILFSPEGQHGRCRLAWLDVTTADLKTSGSFWTPPHTSTTAYNSQPIVYPILDGRLFIRGGDGIYCYDLRKR
ncbi:MAG: PQQ-binding-like beta-propeller repeat protein [Planctomycetota bacterium]|nr:PQQ-binding-like beta-propeller repeat protein [Planctomycetota bacterium]